MSNRSQQNFVFNALSITSSETLSLMENCEIDKKKILEL